MIPFTFLYPLDLDENIRAKQLEEFAGSGGKHIVLSDPILKMLAGNPSIRKQFKRQVAGFGVDFVDSHAPYGYECDLMLPDELANIVYARQMLTLELVHDFGIKTCVFHIGNPPLFMEYTLDELHSFVCRALERVLRRAEELDITICLENIFKPINTVSVILELLKKFDSPHLGVCFDSGHANIMEKGMAFSDSRPWGQWEGRGEIEWEHDVLNKLLPHIVTCHLHDNNGSQDQHKLPGQGTVNWQEVMKVLPTAPNLKCMQSEVSLLRNPMPAATLIDTWKEYLAGTEACIC